MPKLKTHKTISKRLKKNKKKIMLIACGQNHFNARKTGKTIRNKRRYKSLNKTLLRNVNYALGK